MQISKKDDKYTLEESGTTIEEYVFKKAIDFSGLMKYLINKNLSEEIKFECKITKPSGEETVLIDLIKDIIKLYNDSTKEFSSFKKDKKRKV